MEHLSGCCDGRIDKGGVKMGTPPERIRSSYYILFNVFGASGFGPFAAVFPVLAYAARFCEEYQSGYYRMIFSRMSPVRFGRIRICTVALSGGVMLAVPIASVCIMAYVLFGCAWALMGFMFAVWIPNRYVALIAPFVLYESMWIGLDRVVWLNPIRLLRGDDVGSYPLAAGMECVYIIAVSTVIMAGLVRRYRNG